MKRTGQMSESIELGIVLALAGGFMDAYSYMCRGQVFANAQTGNMLLFGVHLSQGEWREMFRYLCPVLAFACGIAIADYIRMRYKNRRGIHWRQWTVAGEAMILAAVALMGQQMNLTANCLTSLACGIQVESFRKILGNGIATTMCIGNLRSGVQNLFDYCVNRDRAMQKRSFLYFGIIMFFILGAVLGNFCVRILAERAIFLCSGILLIAFIMMFADRDKGNGLQSNL